MLKRLLVLALLLITTLSSALAEETAFQPIYPLRMSAPTLTADGFLPEDSAKDYYLLVDDNSGDWTYIDRGLFINIHRYNDVVERNRRLIWYETEIKLAPGMKLTTQHANPEAIGRRYMRAEAFAKQYQCILALSDDFYGFRVYKKRLPGVIIQNGVVLANKTKKAPYYALPTYDLIALYPDGSLKAYLAGSVGANELIAQGVTDTWCFGPLLLSDGELGQQVLNGKFEAVNPRQALGMIAPNHYLVMTIEGRNKHSSGVGLLWTAERMRALGCTEALNLDGGNSVKLVFMGEQLNSDITYNKRNDRTVTSMITLGTFPLDTLAPTIATD